jgi:hypothetical protein
MLCRPTEVLQHQMQGWAGGAIARPITAIPGAEVLLVKKPSDFRPEQYLQYLQHLSYADLRDGENALVQRVTSENNKTLGMRFWCFRCCGYCSTRC